MLGPLKACGHSDAAEEAFTLSPQGEGAAASLLVTHSERIQAEGAAREKDRGRLLQERSIYLLRSGVTEQR